MSHARSRCEANEQQATKQASKHASTHASNIVVGWSLMSLYHHHSNQHVDAETQLYVASACNPRLRRYACWPSLHFNCFQSSQVFSLTLIDFVVVILMVRVPWGTYNAPRPSPLILFSLQFHWVSQTPRSQLASARQSTSPRAAVSNLWRCTPNERLSKTR